MCHLGLKWPGTVHSNAGSRTNGYTSSALAGRGFPCIHSTQSAGGAAAAMVRQLAFVGQRRLCLLHFRKIERAVVKRPKCVGNGSPCGSRILMTAASCTSATSLAALADSRLCHGALASELSILTLPLTDDFTHMLASAEEPWPCFPSEVVGSVG